MHIWNHRNVQSVMKNGYLEKFELLLQQLHLEWELINRMFDLWYIIHFQNQWKIIIKFVFFTCLLYISSLFFRNRVEQVEMENQLIAFCIIVSQMSFVFLQWLQQKKLEFKIYILFLLMLHGFVVFVYAFFPHLMSYDFGKVFFCLFLVWLKKKRRIIFYIWGKMKRICDRVKK